VEDTDHDGRFEGGETDPTNPDTDGDGLLDGEEDIDGDGFVDPTETDPRESDTDDGGEDDGPEVMNGRNPLDPDDDFGGTVPIVDAGAADAVPNLLITGSNAADGCAVSPSSSQPAIGLLGLVLLLGWRRRRR
jgi:MYXO-CTERM domain-containing protein